MSEQQEPQDMNASVSYHEDLATKWGAMYSSGSFNRRLVHVREILRAVVRQNTRWLDAGCGSGVLTRELVQFGATGVAVDGSPGMIAAAIVDAGNKAAPFEYNLANIENLAENDAAFDGVLCSSVVEYLARPEHALSEFFRVLKPGGTLLVSVPNGYSLVRVTQKLVRRLGTSLGMDLFTYLSFSRHNFSPEGIRTCLEQHGFVVDRINSFDPVLPRWLQAFMPGSLLVIVAHKPEAT